MDDEKLVYPAHEKFQKAGLRNVCVHKVFLPPSIEKQFPESAAGMATAFLALKSCWSSAGESMLTRPSWCRTRLGSADDGIAVTVRRSL
jgi:hypothetical protein